VQVHDPLGDGKAEARSPRARREKGLEDALEVGGGIPAPRSLTVKTRMSPSAATDASAGAPAGEACTAFWRRLVRAWRTRSASSGKRAGAPSAESVIRAASTESAAARRRVAGSTSLRSMGPLREKSSRSPLSVSSRSASRTILSALRRSLLSAASLSARSWACP